MKLKIELDSSKLKNPSLILKLVLIVILAIILIFFEVGFVEIIIAFYFLFSIIFPVKSQYSYYLGIIFLLLTSFLSIFGKEEVAEKYAVYAFYFLVIATILVLIEVIKNKKIAKTC